MTSTIIALLIAMNLLSSSADWDNLTPAEQEEMTEIVITDITET